MYELDENDVGKLVPLTRRVFFMNMFVVILMTVVVESSRGLFIPSLAHSVKSIGGSTFDLGVLVAIKSVGRFFSSPVMGWVSQNKTDSSCLYVSCLLSAGGGLLFVLGMIKGRIWLLAMGRLTAGLGGGVLGPIRAHIAKITTVRERVTYMAMCAAAQYFGFAMVPVVGIWFHAFDYNALLNSDTAPAWILFGLNLIMPIVIFTMFTENVAPAAYASLIRTASGTQLYKGKEGNPNISGIAIAPRTVATYKGLEWKTIVKIGIFMYMSFNFASRAVISVVETTGALQFQTLYHVSDFEFIQESSFFFAKVGCAGYAVFCLTLWFAKKQVPEEYLLLGSFVTIGCGSLMLTLSAPTESKALFNLGFVLVWSIGFPIKQTCLLSSFSKILGAKPQGMLMGWIATLGSLGRIVFPILVGLIGVEITGWINVGLCFLVAVLLLCYILLVRNFRKWSIQTPNPSVVDIATTYGSTN